MNIAILGAHGQIAMLLHPMLAANQHHVRGLIRNPDHADQVQRAGAEPVICDVEKLGDISACVGQADLVIFAAGAGPGSGEARKFSVDRDGAIKLMEACKKNSIQRYIMISAMRTDEPRGNEVFQAYLQAKAQADEALRKSGLAYTIIKPGRLTDKLPTGHVALEPSLPPGEISRADVAGVLAEIVDLPQSAGHEWDLTTGESALEMAVRRAAGIEPAGKFEP